MKIVIIFFLLTIALFPQIKVSWDLDQTGNTLWYNVYYCSGADSSVFPLKDGMTHDQVWDWQTGSTLYPYFYVKQPFVGTFFRVGVIGVSADGTPARLSVQTYRTKNPSKVTGIKVIQ